MAGQVKEFTDGNWQSEVLGSKETVLVDFWAPWCGPCLSLAPTIEKLSNEFVGKVKIGKMDTDKNSDIPASLGISSIPTVVFFQNGKEVRRLVGLNAESKFKSALTELGVTAGVA
jgi:thioredoxin